MVILEPEDQKEATGEEKEEEGLVEAPQTPGSEADGDMQHDGVEEEPAGVVIEELASDAEGEEGRPAEEDRPEEDEVVIIEEPGEAAVRDQPPEVVIVEELGPEEAVEPGEPAETDRYFTKKKARTRSAEQFATKVHRAPGGPELDRLRKDVNDY